MSEGEGHTYDPAKDASAQEPLTDNEKKLVTRLFGDPFAFPLEYKAWLRGWLEEQFPRIGTLAVSAASGAAGSFVPPAGAILDYGGDVAPGGYVFCDGAEYDKTQPNYGRLFDAIGFKYGTGSTGNMFLVPDFRERVAVMKGSLAEVDTVGKSDGMNLGNRGPRHYHSVYDPGHVHGGVTRDAGAPAYTAGGDHTSFFEGNTDGANTDIFVGVSGRPLDGPAFLVINKIISLGS